MSDHPRPTVAILDYEAGNLRSAHRALERAGARAVVTGDADEASTADALVVPGVGHFGQCVRQFRAAGLETLVRRWHAAGRPLLGICVGMQILYDGSEEAREPGLGVLPGRVSRLPEGLPVPHMGWNRVEGVTEDPLLDGVAGRYAYFVHSYHAVPADSGHVVARCTYSTSFPSVIRVGSAVATQFHPEKSGDVGARLLANFVLEVQQQRPAA